MKNLLIHLDGQGYEWQAEVEPLMKVQIDNSLRFWDRKDILLVTNLDYEYNGVKALVIEDWNYCEDKPTVSKVLAILRLFDKELIGEDTYWFHDLDAFQLAPLDYTLTKDMALTDYGITTIRSSYNARWSTGSWFFKKAAHSLFHDIMLRCLEDGINEEAALGRLIAERPSLRRKIDKLNISYNFATRKRNVEEAYKIAKKPLKVLHFHPYDDRPLSNGMTNMEYCLPLLPQPLQVIFNKHL